MFSVQSLFSVSELLLMLLQIIVVRELLPTRTNVLPSQMLRLNVAFTVPFGRERLRAVRADEALLSVDHRHSGRPVKILQAEKQ